MADMASVSVQIPKEMLNSFVGKGRIVLVDQHRPRMRGNLESISYGPDGEAILVLSKAQINLNFPSASIQNQNWQNAKEHETVGKLPDIRLSECRKFGFAEVKDGHIRITLHKPEERESFISDFSRVLVLRFNDSILLDIKLGLCENNFEKNAIS